MIEIHADEVAMGFLGGHLNQEVSHSKANFQLQRLMVPELGLPVRPLVGIKKIGVFFRNLAKEISGVIKLVRNRPFRGYHEWWLLLILHTLFYCQAVEW